MGFQGTSHAKPVSEVPEHWHDQVESLMEKALPTLCYVDVRARQGRRKGRMRDIGLSRQYRHEEGDTAEALASVLCDDISEHRAEYGEHVYEIVAYIADQSGANKNKLDSIEFTLGEDDVDARTVQRDAYVQERLHSTRTIKELEGSIVRLVKLNEHTITAVSQFAPLIAGLAQVEAAREEVRARRDEREAQHQEHAETMDAVKTVFGPAVTSIARDAGPALAAWLRKKAGDNTDTDAGTPPTVPPWQRLATLLATFTDEQRTRVRAALGDGAWASLLRLADVDTREAFQQVADEMREGMFKIFGTSALERYQQAREHLSPEQQIQLDGILAEAAA